MRQRVELYCEYSGCPGYWWSSRVWFTGSSASYRVWTQRDQDRQRILLKHAHESLGWRRMVADIREVDDVGLGGDLLEHIEVSGNVTTWQASLLKMAWIKFDSPAGAQFEFLLTLHDDTIAMLAEAFTDLADQPALIALRDVIDIADSLHVARSTVEDVIDELMPALTITDQDDRLTAIENCLSRLQPLGPSLIDVVELRNAEQMARLACGPSPSDPKAVALLLERWTAADPKPAIDETRHVRTGSTAAFLHWATQRVGPAGFASLVASDRNTARRFAQAFLAHANGEILRCQTGSGGGTIGAAIRASKARSWADLKEQILGESVPASATTRD